MLVSRVRETQAGVDQMCPMFGTHYFVWLHSQLAARLLSSDDGFQLGGFYEFRYGWKRGNLDDEDSSMIDGSHLFFRSAGLLAKRVVCTSEEK
jgi:hypothetical protein